MQPLPPAPLYYLDNYRTLLLWVRSRYGDLLSDHEKFYADQFLALSEPAQALLTRMITRKGEHFRVSKLAYEEISDMPYALTQLAQLGWLNLNPLVSLGEIFKRLTRPELTLWLGAFSGTKVQWLAALEQTETECLRWDDWFNGAHKTLPAHAPLVGDIAALTVMPLSDLYSLLFFGNHHQELNEFVLAELGVFQYEQVAFSDASRSFNSRADVEAYCQLQRAHEQFDLDADINTALAALPCVTTLPFWLVRRVERFRFQLGYKHEQRKNYEQALGIYSQCTFSEARARHVRVLEKLARVPEALSVLDAALLAPFSEAERQQLFRARPRLQRALGLAPERNESFKPISASVVLPVGALRVELAAAEYFHTAAAPVYWVENYLWAGLFGLFFWSAIYAPVQGAFFNPFQARPKDLYHQSFVECRITELQACWQLFESADYKAVLRQRYREKQGLQSPFMNWTVLSEALLVLALECISIDYLSVIFRRMLFDIKANAAGFPDLIQFMPEHNQFRLIEVKGPGDKLQDNQLRWLEFFAQHNIAAETCYVQWAP